ncbi:MAG: hypothetical protein HMLKMBBP_00042 [Planctomycetes bacterium]|nr:hypothetical protein [Planctomycetota bacterium]
MSPNRIRRTVFLLALCTGLVSAAADDPLTSFLAPAGTTGTADPVALAAADFDSDGDTDLLFADGTVGLVKIRRNEGDGVTYATTGFTVTGATVLDAAVGDLDGDTDPDVALATSAGTLIALNQGLSGASINFTQGTPTLPAANAFPTRIALADYDGDGDLDVITVGAYDDMVFPAGGYVGVQLNASGAVGAGTIEPRVSQPDGVAAGDLNGDGRAEIVYVDDLGTAGSSQQWLVRNPGTGSIDLTNGQQDPLTAAVNGRDCVIADITGDARPDLVVGGWGDYSMGQNIGAFTLLRNVDDGGGAFHLTYEIQIIHTFPAGTFAGPLDYPVAVADMNGAGGPEIVTISPLEDVVKVFHFTVASDAGGFIGITPGQIVAFAAGDAPEFLAVAQLNAGADSKPDVAVAIPGQPAGILLNSTSGGGGGEPLRGALSLAAKAKAVKGDYSSTGKWKFTCVQPENGDGLAVRVQSTTTPGVEGSWTDLPGAPPMTRGKNGKYSLTTFQVPVGLQYFRTVTSMPGRPDGINLTPDGLDRYIGPFNVVSGAPSLLLTAEIIPFGDPVNRTKTFPGDLIAFNFTVRNTSDFSLAREVEVLARLPRQTTLVGVIPENIATLINNGTKVRWTVGDLGPGEEQDLGFGVIVDPDASGAIRFDNMSASGANTVNNQRDPPGAVELELGSPLAMTLAARTTSPRVGGALSYDLTATNVGSSTYTNAVVVDSLPKGTAFDLAYFSDENGDPVASPVAGPGGRLNPHVDRAARKVYWYLGDLDGGEVVRMRLDVNVQYDVMPGSELNNFAWQLRAVPPGATGDPLNFDRLPADSGSPSDVVTVTSDLAPPSEPVLRLSQFAVVPNRPGSRFDRAYGAVTTVVAGGRVTHTFIVQNTGGADAEEVILSGNLASQTTYSADDGVRVTNLSTFDVGMAQVEVTSGGTLTARLGPVPAGSAYAVQYVANVSPSAKAGTTLAFSGFNLKTDSLDGFVFGDPPTMAVLVSQPFAPNITVTGPPQGNEGDFMRYVASLSNAGDVPGASCRVTLTIPKGMRMADAPGDAFVGGAALYDHDGNEVQVLPVDPSAKSVTFSIPLARAGSVGTAVLVAQVVKRQPSVIVPCTGTFTGTTANGKSGGKQVTAEYATSTEVLGQAELVLFRTAPVAASKRLEFGYILGVCNTSPVDAEDVTAYFEAPSGVNLAGVPVPLEDTARVRGRKITWDLGTVPAHSSRILRVQVEMDDEPPGVAIVETSFRAESSNAIVRLPDPTATIALTPSRRFETFRWPALSAILNARGMKLEASRLSALDNAVQTVNSSGFNASVAGGIATLNGGTFMLPLGGGNIVAAGGGNIVAAGGGNIVAAGGGNIVAAGGGNLITFSVSGFGTLDASQLLSQMPSIVAAGGGNIVAAGGGNLVGLDGASLVGLDGASILANLSPLVTSNIVAAGGGNIVAAGGGNIVAAGGGNIVAAGGGNIVAAGGLNLLPSPGASIVAAGGGNIVAAGGGNIVAAGGGNIVAAGGGNIVAAGGGNIVAAGGLNKTLHAVKIRAKGLPAER